MLRTIIKVVGLELRFSVCGKWEAGSGHDTAGITRPSANSLHQPSRLITFLQNHFLFFFFVEFSLFEGK